MGARGVASGAGSATGQEPALAKGGADGVAGGYEGVARLVLPQKRAGGEGRPPKLCLPFWSGLPPEGRKEADGVVDMFSWLVYGYYRQALPEQLRRIAVVGSREALLEKGALWRLRAACFAGARRSARGRPTNSCQVPAWRSPPAPRQQGSAA